MRLISSDQAPSAASQRYAIVLSLSALAGCSLIFGFEGDATLRPPEPEAGIDAAMPDVVDAPVMDTAPPMDAAPDVPQETGCTSMTLPAVNAAADTFIFSSGNCNNSIRYGGSDTNNLGMGGSSRVLLRFVLSQAMTDALNDGTLSAAKLKITLRASGGACGGACPNGATTFQVFTLTDGWNEGGAAYVGADWCNRIGVDSNTQTPWQSPGGDGSSDRSMVALATSVVTAQQAAMAGAIETNLTINMTTKTELVARRVGNNLSFILVPTAGGTLFLLSREAMAASSQLTFTTCK